MEEIKTEKPSIWFVYDGECPICQMGAALFKVRQSVGELHTVDARTEPHHPVMQGVNAARLDLDQGMVIKYLGQLYQGEEALRLMAKIGADQGLFNKINRALFQSETMVRFGYPPMRFARNVALAIKGVGKIRNLQG